MKEARRESIPGKGEASEKEQWGGGKVECVWFQEHQRGRYHWVREYVEGVKHERSGKVAESRVV